MSCLDQPTQQLIIQCLLDGAVTALNAPSNPFYVPNFVKSQQLDPYMVAQGNNWTIDNFTSPAIVDSLSAVCTAIQEDNDPCKATSADNFIPSPNVGVTIVLSQVVVTGASNMVIENATASGPNGYSIQVNADLSTLANYPAPITITGSFSLTLYCCCADNSGNNCVETAVPEVGSGTFTATVANSSLAVNLTITDLAKGVLQIAANSVVYTASVNNIVVTPLITSISGKALASYQNLVNEAFTDHTTLNFILQQVNVQLNEQGALDLIGTTLTKDLDGYLQANNTYPFNESAAAAF